MTMELQNTRGQWTWPRGNSQVDFFDGNLTWNDDDDDGIEKDGGARKGRTQSRREDSIPIRLSPAPVTECKQIFYGYLMRI